MSNAESEKQPTNEQKEPPLTAASTQELLQNEIARLSKESAEYKDKYLRQLAEMDNMRKRLQKDRQEISQTATENVIIDFLNPIDHMENALKYTQQMSDEIKHWGVGFQMILTQFKDALANNGVTAFTAEGQPFDPHLHEAVEIEETDKVPPGIVLTESVKGYKMGERTIRPARVKVSKALSAGANETTEK